MPINETIRSKCQGIWIQALDNPITLQFEKWKDVQRARFTFYDSIKDRAIHTLLNPPDYKNQLLKARDNVEIIADRKGCTLTLSNIALNPYHLKLESELDTALDQSLNLATKDGLEKSLLKLQSKLDGGQEIATNRPGTKYFTRED